MRSLPGGNREQAGLRPDVPIEKKTVSPAFLTPLLYVHHSCDKLLLRSPPDWVTQKEMFAPGKPRVNSGSLQKRDSLWTVQITGPHGPTCHGPAQAAGPLRSKRGTNIAFFNYIPYKQRDSRRRKKELTKCDVSRVIPAHLKISHHGPQIINFGIPPNPFRFAETVQSPNQPQLTT